jgi:hypothetical protein
MKSFIISSSYFAKVIKPRSVRCVEHVALMGGMRNEYKILVGKPVWKGPAGRPTPVWQD